MTETAGMFRREYYRIVDVEDGEFDKGELDDLLDEARLEISDALRDDGLL